MSDRSQVIKINIFGQDYAIRAKVEGEEYVRSIADYVDSKMREIDDTMRPSSAMKVAILTALNIADELMAAKRESSQELEEYRGHIQEIVEDLDKDLNSDR